MKKTILAVAAVIALSTTSVFAFGGGQCQQGMQANMGCGMAQGTGMMHGGKGGMMGFPMLERLNLTDEQEHKLDVLRSEFKLEISKMRDPKMMTKMQDLMTADTFNKKEFIKLHNEMHDKMLALQADHMEKVFNVLTKEQRAELKKLMNERPAKRPVVAPAPATETK